MKRESTGIVIIVVGIVLVYGAVKGTWPAVWKALTTGQGPTAGGGTAQPSGAGAGGTTGGGAFPTIPGLHPSNLVPAPGWPGSGAATE